MRQTMILNMSILLVLAAAANAQQPDEGKTCSNETLKGAYGGVISGTRPAPSIIPGGPGAPGQLEQAIGLIAQRDEGLARTIVVVIVRGLLHHTVHVALGQAAGWGDGDVLHAARRAVAR